MAKQPQPGPNGTPVRFEIIDRACRQRVCAAAEVQPATCDVPEK
jgi:hypothetical protein